MARPTPQQSNQLRLGVEHVPGLALIGLLLMLPASLFYW
jgi:hypothetical protein